MKTFDSTKPVQTRDGRSARIIATNSKRKDYPIVALVQDGEGEYPLSFTAEGLFYARASFHPNQNDLINIPEKVKVKFWVNVYKEFNHIYPTREQADRYVNDHRLACILIEREVTEGEGL